MPCNSVAIQPVAIGLAKADQIVLAEALKVMGWTLLSTSTGINAYRGSDELLWAYGKDAVVTANRDLAEEIRQGYSRQIVHWAAKKAGWKLQDKGQQILATRRS
jgi:hypothetical protein